ncbi:uncharacterized protein LOC144616708 isoform X3 [Panthera onca]
MRMFDTLRSFLMHAFGISSASTWCDEKTERPQNSGQAQVNLFSETEKWSISRTKMKSLYTEPGRGEHNPPDQVMGAPLCFSALLKSAAVCDQYLEA